MGTTYVHLECEIRHTHLLKPKLYYSVWAEHKHKHVTTSGAEHDKHVFAFLIKNVWYQARHAHVWMNGTRTRSVQHQVWLAAFINSCDATHSRV